MSCGKATLLAALVPPASHCLFTANRSEDADDHIKLVVGKLCSTFKEVCRIGQQLHEHGSEDKAEILFSKLRLALKDFPGLRNSTIANALNTMATFYKEIEDWDSLEFVVEDISSILPMSGHRDDIWRALAETLPKSAARITETLDKLFKDEMVFDKESTHICPKVSASQLAARYSIPKISSLLAESLDRIECASPVIPWRTAYTSCCCIEFSCQPQDLVELVARSSGGQRQRCPRLSSTLLCGHEGPYRLLQFAS